MAEVVGTIVPEDKIMELASSSMLLVVGDICALTLFRNGITPKVSIVDYRTQRGGEGDWRDELRTLGDRALSVVNPKATITRQLWEAVKRAIEGPDSVRIEVEGEEDLASLACISLAPLGATVIYGIPDVGMMSLIVDERIKLRVTKMLEKMEV